MVTFRYIVATTLGGWSKYQRGKWWDSVEIVERRRSTVIKLIQFIDLFKEKGYDHLSLQELKQNVQSLDRTNLLGDRRMAFLTNFNYNYKGFEKIINIGRSCWGITVWCPFLPIKPRFVHCSSPNSRDRLVHNQLDPPRNLVTFRDQKGFYICGRCKAIERGKPRLSSPLSPLRNIL